MACRNHSKPDGRSVDMWGTHAAVPLLGRVAFTVGDASGERLEVWKMEHFLPALSAKK